MQTALDDVKMLTDSVCIKDGVVVEVDVTLDLVMDKFYRKFQDEFNARVNNKISGFFSLNNWDYGQALKSLDLIKEISDIKEFKTIELSFLTNDPNNSVI